MAANADATNRSKRGAHWSAHWTESGSVVRAGPWALARALTTSYAGMCHMASFSRNTDTTSRHASNNSRPRRATLLVFSTLLLAAVLMVFLVRIVRLERHVGQLALRLGSAGASQSDRGHVGSASDSVRSSYAQRLAALEAQVAATIQSLRQPNTAAITDPRSRALRVDEQVLSVIKAEKGRVREQLLDFWRERWLETRKSQVATFAKQNDLSAEQASGIEQVLARETDDVVALLSKPDLEDDPDSAAETWNDLRERTDEAGAKLLIGTQVFRWYQARTFERQLLWPWLQNNAPVKADSEVAPQL